MKVINLWGGPGSGKSTTAAALFSLMKLNQVKVELVTEFAKDLTYEQNYITLSNQLLVSGQQEHRLRRLVGSVDYAITDSPLPLGILYASGIYTADWFRDCIWGAFETYENINFFIKRVKPYAEYGRSQSESEADKIAEEMQNFMVYNAISCKVVDGDHNAASAIYRHLVEEAHRAYN